VLGEQRQFSQKVTLADLGCLEGGRGDRLKVLWWDGGGLCLFAKRLEKGRFVWPRVEEGAIALTPAQLAMLIEGFDWRRAIAFKDLPTPSAV
jgi:transposase